MVGCPRVWRLDIIIEVPMKRCTVLGLIVCLIGCCSPCLETLRPCNSASHLGNY